MGTLALSEHRLCQHRTQHLLFTLLTSKLRSLGNLVLLNSCVGIRMGKTTKMGVTPLATIPDTTITSKHMVILGNLPSGEAESQKIL